MAVSELSTEAPGLIEDVYRDERLGLIRLAFLLTGARDQAEDIVQSAFEAAQPRWDELDDPRAFRRRVVVNRAQDLHRRRYRPRPQPEPPVTHIPELDETWADLRLPRRRDTPRRTADGRAGARSPTGRRERLLRPATRRACQGVTITRVAPGNALLFCPSAYDRHRANRYISSHWSTRMRA
jgi:DNA-directed RNA polymerase specialized sigma24 family protein